MKESVVDELIRFGLYVGVVVLFFGISYGLMYCILKCFDNNDHPHDHEHNNNDDHVTITIMECDGIGPFILRSIPIVEFNSKDFKDVVECVVCLSELVDGEKARVLPSCDHWFHAACIDSWLQSHSTCPICRKIVCSEQQGKRRKLGGGGHECLTQTHDRTSEHQEIPTNPSPRSTDTTIIEDGVCGGADEAVPDFISAVV